MELKDVLEGYAADAPELIPAYESLDTPDVLAHVASFLPSQPSLILDVGAGTGRDAAWLALTGHTVVAVEPVQEMRDAGAVLHQLGNFRWLDDSLPTLSNVLQEAILYDLVLIIGVWQHLPEARHKEAVCSLSKALARGGRLIISVRHGPGSPNRPCFHADPDLIIALAHDTGLRLLFRYRAPSLQKRNRELGVTWTWLCFEKDE